MKIGIFGGTFDPWTLGHSVLCQKSAEKLDKVFIVPTVCDYYRKNYTPLFSFDERCRIIDEFLTGISGSVEIDTIEKGKPETWRSIDTLKYFKEKFPNDELYFIIGGDSYEAFSTWFRYDDILLIARLLVFSRGKKLEEIPGIPAEFIDIDNQVSDISATKVRQKLRDEIIDMYMNDKEWYNA